jgi:ribosome maturation protein SDO1
MPTVTAKIRKGSKHYEIKVDLDEALKIQKGEGDITAALESTEVYYDVEKGTVASQSDLKDAFKTTDLYEAAKQIIEKGDVQKTQEFRDEQQEQKVKQLIDLLLTNASDQNGNPYTEDRLRRAIDEVHYKIDSRQAEQQLSDLLAKLKEAIPIKIETKRIKLIIPAQFTGQAYGILQDYKEKETWLENGDLEVILNIPSGMQTDFYEKLNAIAHGAVQSEKLTGE